MARPMDMDPTIIIHICIHHILTIHIYTAQEQIAIMAVVAGMASSGEESKSIWKSINVSFSNDINSKLSL